MWTLPVPPQGAKPARPGPRIFLPTSLTQPQLREFKLQQRPAAGLQLRRQEAALNQLIADNLAKIKV